MSEKIHSQHEEIVEALGKKLLNSIKDTSTPEYIRTLAEAYETVRRAGLDY